MSKRPFTGDTEKIIESLRAESGGADNIKHVDEHRHYHYEPDRGLGVITASGLQAGHKARWNYTVKAAILTSTGYEILTGTKAKSVTAINLIELAHIAEPGATTPWYVWGVQSHSGVTNSNYPAGFSPLPVGSGATGVGVTVTERTDKTGNTVYAFEASGSHDGTCT